MNNCDYNINNYQNLNNLMMNWLNINPIFLIYQMLIMNKNNNFNQPNNFNEQQQFDNNNQLKVTGKTISTNLKIISLIKIKII